MNSVSSDSSLKQIRFSFRRGLYFFIKANILLFSVVVLFLINTGKGGLEELLNITLIFIFPAEMFIMILSFINMFKPNQKIKRKKRDNISKNEWIGMTITFGFLSIFSLLFLGAGISFPSTLVFLAITTNFMFALYSIIFHPITIALYYGIVFREKETITDYIFKHIVMFTSGINYYVQISLKKLPLILNKMLAIIFVLLLLWLLAAMIAIFDWT